MTTKEDLNVDLLFQLNLVLASFTIPADLKFVKLFWVEDACGWTLKINKWLDIFPIFS